MTVGKIAGCLMEIHVLYVDWKVQECADIQPATYFNKYLPAES